GLVIICTSVGNAEQFPIGLEIAIFAGSTVDGIENCIRFNGFGAIVKAEISFVYWVFCAVFSIKIPAFLQNMDGIYFIFIFIEGFAKNVATIYRNLKLAGIASHSNCNMFFTHNK